VFEIVFVTLPPPAADRVVVTSPVVVRVEPHVTAPVSVVSPSTSRVSDKTSGRGIDTVPVQLIVMVPLELATMILPRQAVPACPKSKIEFDVEVLAKMRNAVSRPAVPQ
jgi:hypothetical protein